MLADLIDANVLAIEQLPERRLRGPLLATLGWTVLVFVMVWIVAVRALGRLGDRFGEYGFLAQATGFLLLLIATWIGFAVVENAILSFYADRVVDGVIERHYPDRGRSLPARLGDTVRAGLRLSAIALAANVLALPFYLFLPVINLVLFLGLNGYVLGRGYFDAVALRRMNDRAARSLWRAHRGTFIVNGAVAAFLSTVPVLNLVVPIVGLAATVHLLERRCGGARQRELLQQE